MGLFVHGTGVGMGNIDIYFVEHKSNATILIERRSEDKRSDLEEILSVEKCKRDCEPAEAQTFALMKAIACLDGLSERDKIKVDDRINFYGLRDDHFIHLVDYLNTGNMASHISQSGQDLFKEVRELLRKEPQASLDIHFTRIGLRNEMDRLSLSKIDKIKIMSMEHLKKFKYNNKHIFKDKEKYFKQQQANSSYYIENFLKYDKENRQPIEKESSDNVITEKLKAVKNLHVYTDGSVIWNKEDGHIPKGYGVVIVDADRDEVLFKIKGRIKDKLDMMDKTSLVELYAIERACAFIGDRMLADELKGLSVAVMTDAIDYANDYKKYFSNVHKTAFPDLWLSLRSFGGKLGYFDMSHVKSHDGNIYNEMADKLAKSGAYFTEHKEVLVDEPFSQKDELMRATEHLVEDVEPVKRLKI